jgi:hypothetical protein
MKCWTLSGVYIEKQQKKFCLVMMITAIFGHVATIIHNNMTQATAKYHEMLDAVR